MAQNKTDICLVIYPLNEKSKKFFTEEGLKEFNAYLEAKAPLSGPVSKITPIYNLPPFMSDKSAKSLGTTDPIMSLHNGAKIIKGYDHAFIITFYDYNEIEAITAIMQEKRQIIALPQIIEFFKEKKINTQYFLMEPLND